MTSLLLDHLWQSTLFAAVAALLTLAFAANGAAIRFWLWFAASVKFLIPFSALTAFGAWLFQSFAPKAPPPIFSSLAPAAQPFSGTVTVLSSPVAQAVDWTPWILSLWALGFAIITAVWLGRWLKLRAALADATLLAIGAPVPVKSSSASLEPGLIGIWRPVLLLPRGIETQLSATELHAILAHEQCHLRRHDNLLAAIHMLVEALFWFHPLVWWLGGRLIAERENACDEAVLSSGNDPQIYAESILKVCQFYLHSPLACASGVSGADLKKRIEAIMESKFVIRLNAAKKSLLTACAAIAIAAPLALGLLTATPTVIPAFAQAVNMAHPGTEAALRHQLETAEKTGQMDYDEMEPSLALIARSQSEPTRSNFKKYGALKSITFRENQNGNDVFLVEFENQLSVWTIAPVRPDGKIGPTLFYGPAIKRSENGPSPGLEAAIRKELDGNFSGTPALEIMSPPLQVATQRQWPVISTDGQSLGAVQTVTFQNVNARGWDVYHATFANGSETIQAAPLMDGKLSGILHSDIRLPHQPQHRGTEISLRRYIESLESGKPNYDEMEPIMAATVKQQLPDILVTMKPWGALRSIAYQGGGTQGMDIYEVTFEHAKVEWNIAPLDADGKVVRRGFRQIS